MTTNQIAERAGVNIASLYQYFPNKQAILVELMRRHVGAARRGLAERIRAPATSVRARVRALVEATVAEHRIDPELHAIYTTWGPRLGLKAFTTDSDGAIAEAVQAGIAALRGRVPDPELTLWIAQTSVHAVVHVAYAERPDLAARPELADELVRLLAPYLAGSARRRR